MFSNPKANSQIKTGLPVLLQASNRPENIKSLAVNPAVIGKPISEINPMVSHVAITALEGPRPLKSVTSMV